MSHVTQLAISLRADSDGVLRVGPVGPDPSGPTVMRLGVAGGFVLIDVAERDPVPVAYLHDVDAASWWIVPVYGPTAATRLQELADATLDAPRESLVEPTDEPAPAGDGLRRFALACWLLRWYPTGSPRLDIPVLSDWLLAVEAGDLADELAETFDAPLAQLLLEPHLARLSAVSSFHHSLMMQPVGVGVAQMLRRATATALAEVPADVEGRDDLAERFDELLDEDEAVGGFTAALDDDLVAPLLDPDRSVGAGVRESLTAGGSTSPGDFPIARGADTVDPLTVPARALSIDDGAVTWQVSEDDRGMRIEVRVAAPAPAVSKLLPHGGLFARIDHGGSTSALALEPQADHYAGETWLNDEASLDGLVVTVYTPVDGADGRAPRPEVLRRRHRDTIVSLVQARLTSARSGAVDDAWDAPFAAELVDTGTVVLG